MPRSRSSDTFRSRREDMTQPEGDRFCQSFIKPTQIYRYLRTRFSASPMFLHRNLSYMKGRSKRSIGKATKRQHLSKNEKEEKKAKLANHVEAIKKRMESVKSNENLLISFLNFEDEHLDGQATVEVQTTLEKISHKRRKEGTMEPNSEVIGKTLVEVNSNVSDRTPTVCVTNDKFQLGENIQTTFSLTFDIEVSGKLSQITSNETKKQRVEKIKYCAQLPVIDKQGRNLLIPGMYQISALDPDRVKRSYTSNWEARTESWVEEVNKHWVPNDDFEISNTFSKFEKTAKIVLYFEWSDTPSSSRNTKPKFISEFNNNNKENSTAMNISGDSKINMHEPEVIVKEEPSKERYIFQFVVNQTIKQRMEERTDFVCPWCSVNCMRIYSLMKHLKLCHARFAFQYIEESPVRRIDVYVNDSYDGSYSGAPHDVLLGGSKGLPTRRNVATSIMVFRPRRPTFKMSEFLEADDNDLETRQYFSGHNRIYYHSETCIPILPKELEYDSEGEPNPKWLQRTTKQMIDEFTDVNDGEKELMKLWNLHIMEHGFVGDCQIEVACELFLKDHGEELIRKNLYRNFLVHIDSLSGFGLISATILKRIQQRAIEVKLQFVDPLAEKIAREASVAQTKAKNENRTTIIAKPSLKSVPVASKSTGKLRISRA